MLRLTDVVKYLLIINVLMFLGTQLMGQNRLILAVFYPTSEYFRPFQLVTYMFMHGGVMHIFFNMFILVALGPALEALWGPKKFLFYYLFTGFGALALHFIVKYIELNYLGASPGIINIPTLGASGAIFGILLGFGVYFPNTRLMLIFPPIPVKAKVLVVVLAALELFLGLGGFQTGIAHFAHLGGALFGLLLILYWRNSGKVFKK